MFNEDLLAKAKEFEQYLDGYRFDLSPIELAEAMNYALFSNGKRLRPILLLESCRVYGGDVSIALPLAAGVEMIHCYSLVHDDLPCMDDDDLRRGLPTCHIKFGEPIALLAGDGLLTAAFETMLKGCPAESNENYLKALFAIASAAGPYGMVGGQADDILSSGNESLTASVESIHSRKTGALISSSVQAGAFVAKAEQSYIENIKIFGDSLGLMFQIADDIKDEIVSAEELGKRSHKDKIQGKPSFVAHYGISEARKKIFGLREESYKALKLANADECFLGDILDYVANI